MGVRQLHHSISKPVYSGLSKAEIVIWPRNAISLYWFFVFVFTSASKPARSYPDINIPNVVGFLWQTLRSRRCFPVSVTARWPFKGRLRLLSSFCECCRNEADTGTCRYVLHWIEEGEREIPGTYSRLFAGAIQLIRGRTWRSFTRAPYGCWERRALKWREARPWKPGELVNFIPKPFRRRRLVIQPGVQQSRRDSWNQVRLALSLSCFFSVLAIRIV